MQAAVYIPATPPTTKKPHFSHVAFNFCPLTQLLRSHEWGAPLICFPVAVQWSPSARWASWRVGPTGLSQAHYHFPFYEDLDFFYNTTLMPFISRSECNFNPGKAGLNFHNMIHLSRFSFPTTTSLFGFAQREAEITSGNVRWEISDQEEGGHLFPSAPSLV